MRGGTSKGLFFLADDLPDDPDVRDHLLIRAIGSPDPYRQHMDGLGGATSSTSKVVIVSPSQRPDCDVDYRFGAVAVDRPVIDWSGNCGNLSAAVGPFALYRGLVRAPRDAIATVRIWQADIRKVIHAHVPVADGEVVEDGEFRLDGVAFPGAEIQLEFLDPAGDGDTLFPTGQRKDRLEVPGVGMVDATLINAGNPTIFIHAYSLGLAGTELQRDVNGQADLLALAEATRAAGAVAMGLARSADEATLKRPHTPKLAYVAAPAPYTTSDGRPVAAGDVDLLVRIFSMGPLHHAMTGTGAVAIAVAAAIPGTLVHEVAPADADGHVCFGHPSGTLNVGAEAHTDDAGTWTIRQVSMSRSARLLMDGQVFIPAA